MLFRIIITSKKGLLDPQGRAIGELLSEKGYSVKNVRVGKIVLLEGEDINEIRKVAKFLVNDLIEDFLVEEVK